jgi:hypothetical protein
VSTAIEKVNGHVPDTSHAESWARASIADAEAEAIRARTAAEVEERRIRAEAEAEAIRITAQEEAERQRIANVRARMRLEKEQADHAAHLARKAAETAKCEAEKQRVEQAEAEQKAEEAARAKEQQRSERIWKWGARSIYAVGLIIAAPVQFMHFWDPARKFLVAAPALLEGLALVLAFGAAWAVAHRRDVAPYRIGIMIGAAIAAAINLHGGMTKQEIGFNAGLIGAIASLGGPIVLMAYEHGIAQQADGIPSRRERRAAARVKKQADAAREKAQKEKAEAEAAAAQAKDLAEARAREEQKRRDADRKASHEDVWKVADAMRAARGSQYVTEQIWAEAWYRVTGSKNVGITPEIEAQARAAQARMKTASEMPILGDLSQVESHRPPGADRPSDAPDGRRKNGGTPPRRRPGDTQPASQIARHQARLERVSAGPSTPQSTTNEKES